MVDFNNDTTITRPKTDIINYIILQRRQDFLTEYINFRTYNLKQGGIENETRLASVQGMLLGLIEELRSMLEEGWDKIRNNPYQSIDSMQDQVMNGEVKDILKVWTFIDSYLYSKGITKADKKEITDRKDIWNTKQKYLG